MTVKYRTSDVWHAKIEEVEVERESDKCVWISGRRQAKDGWMQYHETWQAAKDYLVRRAERSVQAARSALERENSKLGNAKGMKP